MTVSPFVVTDGVNQRTCESLELVVGLLEQLVAAQRAARLNVADVERERRFHFVDSGNQPVEFRIITWQVVRHVAQCHERKSLIAADGLSRYDV